VLPDLKLASDPLNHLLFDLDQVLDLGLLLLELLKRVSVLFLGIPQLQHEKVGRRVSPAELIGGVTAVSVVVRRRAASDVLQFDKQAVNFPIGSINGRSVQFFHTCSTKAKLSGHDLQFELVHFESQCCHARLGNAKVLLRDIQVQQRLGFGVVQ
jgi:hypothetical protein